MGQRQHKQRRGAVVEWHFYQRRAHHQYGKTACSGRCISESVARSAVESLLARLLGEELDLSGYLGDAVAAGALDLDAARETTLELREKKERAEKRLAATSSGVELGAELKKALSAVQGDLPSVLAGMEQERLRALVQLVVRRFSVEGYGGPQEPQGAGDGLRVHP